MYVLIIFWVFFNSFVSKERGFEQHMKDLVTDFQTHADRMGQIASFAAASSTDAQSNSFISTSMKPMLSDTHVLSVSLCYLSFIFITIWSFSYFLRRDIQQPVFNDTSKAQDFSPFACEIEQVSLYCTKILITKLHLKLQQLHVLGNHFHSWGVNVLGIIKILLVCCDVISLVIGSLYYNVRWFISLLCVHGDVNILLRVKHEICEYWSPKNNDDSTVCQISENLMFGYRG